MILNQFIFLVFFGVSFQAILGQVRQHQMASHSNNAITQSVVQIQEAPNVVEVDADEDENENDVLTRISDVQTIEEFMSLLQINGRPVTSQDVFDDITDDLDKAVINGGGRLAIPDNCAPRNTTIRITMESTDSDVAFFPRCTKIERCGGCCSSPHLECVPQYTERVSLKVLKGRIPYPGAYHLEFTGSAPVIVDRHMTCRVACTLTEEKCGPKKRFHRRQCICTCKTFKYCPPPTIWDKEDCSCKCPSVRNCCLSNDICGMVFDHTSCQCVLANMVGIAAGGRQIETTAPPTTPAPTTTTTTTTTTRRPRPRNPCDTINCPPTFLKVRRRNSCMCRPRSIRNPRRPPRRQG